MKTRECWSVNEIDVLIKNYGSKTLDEMEQLLPNRKRHHIISKAISLNLTNKVILQTRFTSEERCFVFNNYNNLSDREMGEILNRSTTAINNYRFRNGLIKIHEKSSYNDLSEYIRRNNTEWKDLSMKNCNYKCVVTGNRFDDIHHIYGLNLILNEVLLNLNIEIKEDMNQYSEIELKNILYSFRALQAEYPLGVCLCKKIHKLFHFEYGYGNNTQEQWNDFLLKYKNGVYDDKLKTT